jgi:hypothetical protein
MDERLRRMLARELSYFVNRWAGEPKIALPPAGELLLAVPALDSPGRIEVRLVGCEPRRLSAREMDYLAEWIRTMADLHRGQEPAAATGEGRDDGVQATDG